MPHSNASSALPAKKVVAGQPHKKEIEIEIKLNKIIIIIIITIIDHVC